MEIAREKGTLFDKWCSLRETILLEEFKRCLPDRVVVYLNEQKVFTLSCAAALANEYVLTHRITIGLRSVSTSAVKKKKKTNAPTKTHDALRGKNMFLLP